MKKPPEYGICKLTKEYGKFVKSHIIPESLTSPSIKGNYFLQIDESKGRSKKRWTSWYDKRLVCERGENHLSEIDNWAITELRKHKLVWSGWGNRKSIKYKKIKGVSFGIRVVSGIDKEKLRLFFLSVLWRAASSSLEEFSSIKVSKNELEKLRIMILLKSIKPLSFFPCQLTQLTTKGITHNQSPIQSTIPSLDSMKNNNAEKDLSVFRFYFDGLVTNIYLNMQLNDYDVKKIGGVFVGAEESIIVTAVPFDKSLQINRLFSVITKNMDDIIS